MFKNNCFRGLCKFQLPYIQILHQQVTKLQKQTAILKEKDLKEESLKQKEKQLSVLKNKHKTTLTDLLGNMPEANFAVAVNKYEVQIRSEVDSLKKKIRQKQNEVSGPPRDI